MRKKRKFFYFIPLIVIGVVAVLSAVVMWLWNGVVSDIFNVKKISYLQAAGLFVLCKILLSPFRFGAPGFRRDSRWRQKLMDLSPDERDRFKQEWQKRCGDPATEEKTNE